MSDPAFFATRMGRRFFEATMPKIADQLERLNTTLEAVASMLQVWNQRPDPRSATARQTDTDLMNATVAQIVREHLEIEALERQGDDALGFHEIVASALGIALRAAYQAGIAASLRHAR